MAKQAQKVMQKQVQLPNNPSAVKTKRYILPKEIYVKTAMKNWLKTDWYWFMIPMAIICINAVLNLTKTYENLWIYIIALVGAILFALFWLIQFTGVTQLEQGKMLFKKYSYEIDSRHILMKLNDQEGMPVKWEMVKKFQKTKEAYIFYLSKGQFIYLPFLIFQNEIDIKRLEAILRQKELV